MLFHDAAVILHGVPNYNIKMIMTETFHSMEDNYIVKYYSDHFDIYGYINIDATPKSYDKITGKVLFEGEIKISYNDPEENVNIFITSTTFSIQLTGRYDGMRAWSIYIDENKLELEIGYYDAILKGYSDAVKLFN